MKGKDKAQEILAMRGERGKDGKGEK